MRVEPVTAEIEQTMTHSPILLDDTKKTFKETELGPLPEDWPVSRIAESCHKPEYGYTASAEQEPVGPRFLRITDIQEQGVDWDSVPYCRCDEAAKKKHRLQPGDLLFARIGATTGKSFLVRRCPDAVYASYLIRVRAKTVDPAFLYYFCNSEMYWRQINASKGDKLKGGVSGSVLAQVRHCLPPLPEQRTIAAVLSKIQAAVEVQDKIVFTLKELKAAAMAKLFREGLCGEPLKQTEIGEMPESWEVVSLGDTMKTVYRYPTYYNIEYLTDGIPEVRGELLRPNGTIDTSPNRLRFISTNTAARFPNTRLEASDIVMSVRGTMGKVGIVPTSLAGGVITANLIRLAPNRSRIDSNY